MVQRSLQQLARPQLHPIENKITTNAYHGHGTRSNRIETPDQAPSMHMAAFCSTNLAIKSCFTRSAPSVACAAEHYFCVVMDVQTSSRPAPHASGLPTPRSRRIREVRAESVPRSVSGGAVQTKQPGRPRHAWSPSSRRPGPALIFSRLPAEQTRLRNVPFNGFYYFQLFEDVH